MSAAAALFWALLARRRLESTLAFFLAAFLGCALAVDAVDFACSYLLPLDLAGTAPPDPRNARLRFLITAALQLPAVLFVAGLLVWPFRIRGRSPNSPSDG